MQCIISTSVSDIGELSAGATDTHTNMRCTRTCCLVSVYGLASESPHWQTMVIVTCIPVVGGRVTQSGIDNYIDTANGLAFAYCSPCVGHVLFANTWVGCEATSYHTHLVERVSFLMERENNAFHYNGLMKQRLQSSVGQVVLFS